MNDAKLFRLIGLVFGLVGLFLLVWCWFSYSQKATFLTRAVSTSGQVIDNEHRTSSGGKTTCYPVIAFTTKRNEQREFTSNGSGLCAYAIGEKVQVLYDPATPSEAYEDTFFALWLLPLMLGAMGTGFSTLGFTGWWLNRPLPSTKPSSARNVPRSRKGRRKALTD